MTPIDAMSRVLQADIAEVEMEMEEGNAKAADALGEDSEIGSASAPRKVARWVLAIALFSLAGQYTSLHVHFRLCFLYGWHCCQCCVEPRCARSRWHQSHGDIEEQDAVRVKKQRRKAAPPADLTQAAAQLKPILKSQARHSSDKVSSTVPAASRTCCGLCGAGMPAPPLCRFSPRLTTPLLHIGGLYLICGTMLRLCRRSCRPREFHGQINPPWT